MIMEKEVASGTTEQGAGPVDQENMVAYATHKKLLGEKKSLSARMAEMQVKLEGFELAQKSSNEQALLEKGEFEKLNEVRNSDLVKAKEENTILAQELTKTWKKQAFFSKLPGKLKKPEYENFVDYGSIAIDPETQQVDMQTVELAVNNFSENYADLLAKTEVKTLPGNAPSNTPPKSIESMTTADIEDALKQSLTKALTGV